MALTQISTGMLASGDGTVDLNIDNGTFVVDVSTSRVGIGTTSPSRKLHVDSGTTDTVALFESSGDAAAYLVVKDSGSSGGAFFGANGTSTIIGTGGSTERLRIDSSGNVGIGTSSLTGGNTILNLSRTGSGVGCNMQFANSHNGAFYVGLAGNTSGDVILHSADGTAGMAFGTGNTERMRIDSSGNVIIGGSTAGDAAADNLTLVDSGNAGMTIQAGDTSYASIYFKDSASPNPGYIQYKQGDDFMRFATGGSERMRIDSSGQLSAVSVSNVRLTLGSEGTVGNNSSNWIRGNSNLLQFNNAGGGFMWETAGAEKMRIDSSGNLLVGTTDTNPANNGAGGDAGHAIAGTGYIASARSQDTVALFNRMDNDGDIVDFRKNGAIVGGIGTVSNGLYIASPVSSDSGLRFSGSTVHPCDTAGAPRDNAIDLGYAQGRFKDGYFSGDVNATNFTGVGDGDTFIGMSGSNIMRLSTAGTERMRLDASGQITTNAYNYNNVDGHKFIPAGTFQIGMNYNSTGAEIILVNNRTSGGTVSLMQYRTAGTIEGSIVGNSSGLSISNVSDYRMKENIADLTGSLDVINALQPRTYTYKAGFGKSSETQVGFIAHEFAEEIPSAVTGAKDAVYTQADIDEGVTEVTVGSEKLQTLAYSSDEVITRLIGAIQEQQATITALTARIETLENN